LAFPLFAQQIQFGLCDVVYHLAFLVFFVAFVQVRLAVLRIRFGFDARGVFVQGAPAEKGVPKVGGYFDNGLAEPIGTNAVLALVIGQLVQQVGEGVGQLFSFVVGQLKLAGNGRKQRQFWVGGVNQVVDGLA